MRKLIIGIAIVLLFICVWHITEPAENETPIWATESESIIQWKDPDVSVEIAPVQPEVQLPQIETETVENETEIVESETIISESETLEPEVEDKPEMVLLGEFKITAYCSCKKCCGKWAENRPVDENGNEIVYGASGAVLIPGYSVAVDPKVIPYGTKLYIDGKEYIAHDCGGAIKGNDIDVYILGHQEAWDFAAAYYKKKVEVYMIVEEEIWEQ